MKSSDGGSIILNPIQDNIESLNTDDVISFFSEDREEECYEA